MSCEDVESRPASVITKIEPPAIPVARPNESLTDREQQNNVLRIFFNRLVDSINNLSSNGDSVNDAIGQIVGGDGANGANGTNGGPATGTGDDNSLVTNVAGDTLITNNNTVINNDLTELVGGDPDLTTTENISNLTYDITELNNLSANDVRKYRYWRMVRPLASDSGYIALDEIELFAYDPVLGVDINVAPLASITDSSSTVNLAALNDETVFVFSPVRWFPYMLNNKTAFPPNTNFDNFFIQWDFGSAPQALLALRQAAAAVGVPWDGHFDQFEMEASDDGVEWLRVFYVSWQYDETTGVLPPVPRLTWSEWYWFETTDKLSIPSGGGGLTHILPPKTASFTAVANEFYYCDCQGASADITITLPASPTDGDRLGYAKSSFSFSYEVILDGGTHKVGAISGGGLTYQSSAQGGHHIIYDSSNTEWLLYDSLIIYPEG